MKKIIAILAAVTILGTLVLAGCSTSSSSSESNGTTIKVTCSNSEAGSSVGDGSLTVGEGQVVVFDASGLTEGKLQIELKDGPSASVSAKDTNTFEVPAGDYEAEITVLETANGSAEVRVEAK